jgi:hypothetical protein
MSGSQGDKTRKNPYHPLAGSKILHYNSKNNQNEARE